MYTNADQLPNKMEELKCFIDGREPDIIVITEVIPKAQRQEVPRVRLKLHDYTEFFNFEPETSELGKSQKRGIVIYVKEWLRPQECRPFSDFEEQLWVMISPNDAERVKTLVGGIYRSPSSDEDTSISDLCTLLENMIDHKGKKTQVIVCGDFNIKGIDWEDEVCVHGSSRGSQVFLKKIQDLLLHQHVLEPTRYRQGQSHQTLDLILSDEENTVENLEYFDSLGLSDHIVITCDLSRDVWETRKQQRPKLDYKRADFTSMRTGLKNAQLVGEIDDLDIEKAWELFQSKMNILIEAHVPEKKPPRKKRNMYMTNAALKLRKKKERLWRRYLQTGHDADYHSFARTRNELRSKTRNLKKTFERGLAAKVKENTKAFWAYVNTKVKHRSGIETLKTEDGNIAESDTEKAEALNQFFASVFTQEDLTDVPSLDIDFGGEPLEDIVFTQHEVTRKLKDLDPGKTAGPDNLHPALLKELACVRRAHYPRAYPSS